MIEQKDDYFKAVDNFAKIKEIPTVSIFESKMNSTPKVTIAIPTYKRVDLLKESIESALNQHDFCNYEIIIVDNNPERNCPTEIFMFNNYHSNYRISYYKNMENLGMEGNWNRCVEISKSNWVVLLHDDDLLLANFLTEIDHLINKLPNASVVKPLQYQLKKNKLELGVTKLKIRKKIKRLTLWDGAINNIYGAPTGVLLNKNDIIKFGGFNPCFHPISDYVLFSHIAYKSFFYSYRKHLSVYRWQENISLQSKTLSDFIVSDYNFQSFIFQKSILTRKLNKHILDCKFQNTHLAMKELNREFVFDNSTLNIKYKSKFQIIIVELALIILICLKRVSMRINCK